MCRLTGSARVPKAHSSSDSGSKDIYLLFIFLHYFSHADVHILTRLCGKLYLRKAWLMLLLLCAYSAKICLCYRFVLAVSMLSIFWSCEKGRTSALPRRPGLIIKAPIFSPRRPPSTQLPCQPLQLQQEVHCSKANN